MLARRTCRPSISADWIGASGGGLPKRGVYMRDVFQVYGSGVAPAPYLEAIATSSGANLSGTLTTELPPLTRLFFGATTLCREAARERLFVMMNELFAILHNGYLSTPK